MDQFNKLDINNNRKRINKLSHDLSLWLFVPVHRRIVLVFSCRDAVQEFRKHQVGLVGWVGWGFKSWSSKARFWGAGEAEPGSFEGHSGRAGDCCLTGQDGGLGLPQI